MVPTYNEERWYIKTYNQQAVVLAVTHEHVDWPAVPSLSLKSKV